jgi:hypothetical protein
MEQTWTSPDASVERDGMHLLEIGSRSACPVVPHRSLADARDEDAFRSLVTQHTEASPHAHT